jgi:hypothetical protein
MGSGPYSLLALTREFKRIGVDKNRPTGLALSGGMSREDFMRWIRTIPGDIGHEAFVQRLHAPADAGGPHLPGPDEPEARDVATYVDRELDGRIAFQNELYRLVRVDTQEGPVDFQYVGDAGQAASILRALPDGAGLDAVARALRSARIDAD